MMHGLLAGGMLERQPGRSRHGEGSLQAGTHPHLSKSVFNSGSAPPAAPSHSCTSESLPSSL